MKIKASKIDHESSTSCWWEIVADLDMDDLMGLQSLIYDGIRAGSVTGRLYLREHKDELHIKSLEWKINWQSGGFKCAHCGTQHETNSDAQCCFIRCKEGL